MSGDVLLDTERLGRYLAESAPELGVRRVTSVTRFPAGLSSLSCRIEADCASGQRTLVLRAEPEHGVIPPYDIVSEHELVAKAARAGIPTAEVLHVEADAERLGARFAIVSYIEGDVYTSSDPRLQENPALLEAVQSQFVETLAAIHKVADHGLAEFADSAEAARSEIEVCRRRLRDTQLISSPVLENALDVLECYAPSGAPVVLLHGDYRLPNLKWHDGKLVGVLDWELARLGDPLGDIAFSQTVGMGVCSVNGALLDHYLELTGFELDDFRLAYYHLLEMLKSTIIGLAAARDLSQGGNDLRLMSVAALAESAVPVLGMLARQVQTLHGGSK